MESVTYINNVTSDARTVAVETLELWRYLLGLCLVILAIFSITGNTIVLVVFAKLSHSDIKCMYSTGMVSSSLLIGSLFLPLSVAQMVMPTVFEENGWLCIMIQCIQGFCAVNHVVNSTVTAIWNCLYVMFPLRSPVWCTSTKIKLSIMGAYLIPFLHIGVIYLGVIVSNFRCNISQCHCSALMKETPVSFVLSTIYGITVPLICITVVMNTCVLMIARKHIRKIKRAEASLLHLNKLDVTPVNGNVNKTPDGTTLDNGNTKPELNRADSAPVSCCLVRRQHKSDWKKVKKFGSFLLWSVLVWVPMFITMNVVAICRQCVYEVVVTLSTGVAYGLASISPPIFFLSHTTYRNVAHKIICSKFK